MRIAKILDFFDLRTVFLYCVAGGSSAAVYFSTFAFLWQFLHIHYKVAISAAYVLSVVTHYTMNSQLTFQGHQSDLRAQLMRYLVMIIFNYLITMLVVHVVVALLHQSPYLGIVMSIGVTVTIGYLMAKFWVFKKKVALT